MAANTIESGTPLAELASKLDLSQVPDKLHCGTCHHFLINAYRTTCCESYMCDTCFGRLEDCCPVCKHKPFSKDLVRPNKAMRGTAKAYLKSIEKAQAEERIKPQSTEPPVPILPNPQSPDDLDNGISLGAKSDREQTGFDHAVLPDETPVQEVQPSIETGSMADVAPAKMPPSPPGEEDREHRAASYSSDEMEDDDDEIEIQVEPAEGDQYQMQPSGADAYEEDGKFANSLEDNSQALNDNKEGANGIDTSFGNSSMGMNFNMNMQPMQMMQQMQQMMMGNPMMGAMGMNSNMFGGFQNGGLNGMDMNMMNFANQNMFGWNGQGNNNFDNAYANGMNGSFGPSFGFDMSQQGNFQHQFQNGDFHNGYSDYRGRGRGRFRGGRGSFRGRGHFNQFSQNNFQGIQNVFEQSQQNGTLIPQKQAQDPSNGPRAVPESTNVKNAEQDVPAGDFAPGGQAEVQEALGNQYSDSQNTNGIENTAEPPTVAIDETDHQTEVTTKPMTDKPPIDHDQSNPSLEKPIPEAYHEDFDNMAPPTAPLGPSSRHSDRDFGFRSRGRGRYGHYARGSFSQREIHPISPIKTTSPTSTTVSSPKSHGLGVQGAPTGPRAMRDPTTVKSSPAANGSGFQIKGQAAMQSQSQSRAGDRTRSPSVADEYESSDEKRPRKLSRHSHARNSNVREHRDNDYGESDTDRKRKRSRREDDMEYDMQDDEPDYSRRSPPEKRSHRSSRHERERNRDHDRINDRDHRTSKYRSCRTEYDEARGAGHDNVETDMDIDVSPSGYRSVGRSGKASSRHGDSERDRDRDRPSYKDRDSARDRNGDKHKDRDKDRNERHRKRSRHERDRDNDDIDDDEESRHRSRRHKKDHHPSTRRDRDYDKGRMEQDEVGYPVSNRSSTNRNQSASTLPTPTSTKSEMFETEKDPHTLEREARNRERLLKEQQRREKAAADKKGTSVGKFNRGTVSGGRKVSYKYEDEIERSMDESDRRWR